MNWREIKPITDITDFSQIEPDKTIYDDAVHRITEATDKFIFSCFAYCGYSKNYIMTHSSEFSVQKHIGNRNRTFCHGDQKLFTICEEPNFYDLSNPSSIREKYEINLRAEFTGLRKDI